MVLLISIPSQTPVKRQAGSFVCKSWLLNVRMSWPQIYQIPDFVSNWRETLSMVLNRSKTSSFWNRAVYKYSQISAMLITKLVSVAKTKNNKETFCDCCKLNVFPLIFFNTMKIKNKNKKFSIIFSFLIIFLIFWQLSGLYYCFWISKQNISSKFWFSFLPVAIPVMKYHSN